MLQLHTFGGLGVERAGVALTGGGARRRRLTLLAYLAAHGDVGVTREGLLADFWPGSDEAHARNSLKQAVFALRREFGHDVLAPGAGTLRVDRTRLAVDALDFADALDRDDLALAVALYRGPFLDGVALPELPQLERWADAERERFALACARALDTLADRAAAAGRHAECAALRRRHAAMDPLSARTTAALMRALRDAGDRTAALEVWRTHEALVRAELGTGPDAAVAGLAAELRSSLGASPPTAMPSAPEEAAGPVSGGGARDMTPRPTDRPTERPTHRSGERPAAQAPASARPPRKAATTGERLARLARRPWWHVRRSFLVRLAVVGVVGTTLPPVVIRLAAATVVRPEPEAAASLIAVFPFAMRGQAAGAPGTEARVGTGAAELLSLALHGAGAWRAVPSSALLADEEVASMPALTSAQVRAVARRFGAGTYVLGDVVTDGDRLHLAVSMHDAQGRVLAQADAETRDGQLSEAAAELVRALLAQRLTAPSERLAQVAVTSTRSLDALKAWLAGDAAFHEHRYDEAADAFARAAAADPQFALAHYRLAIAADLLGDPARADSAVERAGSLAHQLPAAERALLTAWREAHDGNVAEAERRYEALLDDAPEHAEAWLRLGELRFHANPARGRSVTEARGAFERALALDPRQVEAMVYLARIASLEGRLAEADSMAARARAAAPARGAPP